MSAGRPQPPLDTSGMPDCEQWVHPSASCTSYNRVSMSAAAASMEYKAMTRALDNAAALFLVVLVALMGAAVHWGAQRCSMVAALSSPVVQSLYA